MTRRQLYVVVVVLVLGLVFMLGRSTSTNVTVRNCGSYESGGWTFKSC